MIIMIILILGKGTSNQCHLVVNNLVLFSILDQDFCVVALLLLLPLLLHEVSNSTMQKFVSSHTVNCHLTSGSGFAEVFPKRFLSASIAARFYISLLSRNHFSQIKGIRRPPPVDP